MKGLQKVPFSGTNPKIQTNPNPRLDAHKLVGSCLFICSSKVISSCACSSKLCDNEKLANCGEPIGLSVTTDQHMRRPVVNNLLYFVFNKFDH